VAWRTFTIVEMRRFYEVEVHEDDGEITDGVHMTDGARGYELGDFFDYEGRLLRVFQIEGSVPGYAQRLLCDVIADPFKPPDASDPRR
jgi:hypothetical protein